MKEAVEVNELLYTAHEIQAQNCTFSAHIWTF